MDSKMLGLLSKTFSTIWESLQTEILFADDDDDTSTWSLSGDTQDSKVKGFEMIVEGFEDHIFKQHFRLERKTFESLYCIIMKETDIVEALFSQELRLVRAEEKREQLKLSGKMPIRLRKALLIALWYLGNKESMRSIGNLFGISKSSVHLCVHRICVLFTALSSKIIIWPEIPEDQIALERSFKEKAGFPGVVGVIDGCHINIICPADQQDSYRNRKCGYSMVLQGICSPDKKFLDIFVGYPGSAHDARIYRNSGIFEKADKNTSDIFLSDSYHLLGDSAYPISEFLLTPFKEPVQGSLSGYQTSYNKKHSKTRIVIEHAFGLLKARFRKLHLVDTEIAFIPYVITAACVLHNICETEGDRLEDTIQANSQYDDSSDTPATSIAAANQPQSQRTSRGVAKREAIARAL